jgi:hypothetical protein
VRSAETFLDRKARVCGITRTNKGYSTWPRIWSQLLENRTVSIPEESWHNNLSVDRQKTCGMKSTIHDTSVVTAERRDRTDLEIKKP